MGYLNPDGLYKRFGTAEVTATPVGEYRFDGPFHMVEAKIPDMTVVPLLSAGVLILSDTVIIPVGARIQKVVAITKTIVTGSSSTLDFGLIREDRTTELDYNGFAILLPLGNMDAAGETTELVATNTYVGALVGTTLAYDGLLTVNYNTAAFTAGAMNLQVYWYKP